MDIAVVKGRTKVLIGAIVTAASALQIDAVKNTVMPLVANHPHVSTIVGALITLCALLHNPVSIKLLTTLGILQPQPAEPTVAPQVKEI